MNNFLVLCRMFTDVLTAAERLIFRRGALSGCYMLDKNAEMYSSGHTHEFPGDVLSEHLDFLQLAGAIADPICYRHEFSSSRLRRLCIPKSMTVSCALENSLHAPCLESCS